MPLHQRDFILRLIEQAGAAAARIREMLGLGTVPPETMIHEAETAQAALLGSLWPAVRVLDPASAVLLIGEARQVFAWGELLRLQAAAHDRRGDREQADRLRDRADALEREARHAETGRRS